ncbi:hypothetical protein KZ369_11220, partial [Glaesserella parasuis]|nr:hypothetical protein [Glaesserella parasuis]
KDPSLKEKFIKELIVSENKRKNIQSILDDNNEIKDKLREYGIDIEKEIKQKEDADNKTNKSTTPKEDIDEVTNHGDLSSTIDKHPNVGQKVVIEETVLETNENKITLKKLKKKGNITLCVEDQT